MSGRKDPIVNPLGKWYLDQSNYVKTANAYLHTVIFIVHVLDPGNELTSVEAISDRFVFIALRKKSYKIDLSV